MSYTPTVWQNGDTITAQKMNKLENGVANASGERVLYGLAAVSTDPTVDLPSDIPEAPTGFYWYPQNEYTFVNLQTQEQITLQELSTLNFDNMELRDDVHESGEDADNRTIYIPVAIQNYNTYDPENPAEGQYLSKTINFRTAESSMLVGWLLMLSADNA